MPVTVAASEPPVLLAVSRHYPARPGYRPFRIVIRRMPTGAPYAVHAHFDDDAGGYHRGSYHQTEAEARDAFATRTAEADKAAAQGPRWGELPAD